MKRTVDEIKSIRILKARNGVALIAVLGVLLILTLLVPVMFGMGEIQMEDAMKGTRRQQAYYLARTGVEVGAGAVRNMVTSVYELKIPIKPENKANDKWMNATQLAAANAQYNTDLAKYNDQLNALKGSNPTEFSCYELYQKLKTATAEGGGIFKDGNGRFGVKCDRLWFYMKGDESVYEIKDATETGEKGPHGEDPDYTFVGYCDIEVSYDGGTKYYKEENGSPKEVSIDEAMTNKTGVRGEGYLYQIVSDGRTIAKPNDGEEFYSDDNAATKNPEYHIYNVTEKVTELKTGYHSVTNSAFYITARATVGPNVTEKRAVLVEPANSNSLAGDNSLNFVEYTGTNWENSPDFVKYMQNNSPNAIPYDEITKDPPWDYIYYKANMKKEYNLGGNQCFANPFKADYKQEIKYAEISENIAHPYVYVYTKIGNMILDVDNKSDSYVLGAYPGINWGNNNDWNSRYIDAVNFQDYSEDVQNYNFVSFCASEGLQCNLPVDVRVNPSRVGRGDDKDLLEQIAGGYNADLYKMLSFQAKDIVFDGEIQTFFSFNQKGIGIDYVVGRRMGTVVLAAPDNTPYTYKHQQRNKVVKAGKVYFKDDVYIWLIPWDDIGINDKGTTLTVAGAGQTVYNVKDNEHIKKIKLFNAGDVYYFNAEVQGKNKDTGEMQNLGVSLVNWYLETQYLTYNTEPGILNFFKNFRKNLFVSLVDTFANTDTYESDDMHFIGNVNTDKGLKLPQIENEPCIFWEN